MNPQWVESATTQDTRPDELLTPQEVGRLIKYNGQSVLKHWRSLGLPAPISLGEGPKAAKRWLRGEVQTYVESCIKRRDNQEKVVDMEAAKQRQRRRSA